MWGPVRRGLSAARPSLARQALGPQPGHVGIHRLLRGFVLAHCLLRLRPPRLAARLPFFRREDTGRTYRMIDCHWNITRDMPDGSTPVPHAKATSAASACITLPLCWDVKDVIGTQKTQLFRCQWDVKDCHMGHKRLSHGT
jgi:hypothetical protein